MYHGKNLDSDAKSKQYELVAVQMEWLLDNLDMLEYGALDNATITITAIKMAITTVIIIIIVIITIIIC